MIEKDIIITSCGAGTGILTNSLLKNIVNPIFSVPFLPPPWNKPSISIGLGVGVGTIGIGALWKNLKSDYKGFLVGFGLANTICSLLEVAFPETLVSRAKVLPITPPYKRVPSPAMEKAIAERRAGGPPVGPLTETGLPGTVILS